MLTEKTIRELFGDVFVAVDDGERFLCEPCAHEEGIDLGADETQTWEVGGDGWLGPIACKKCRRSIPVICNGSDEDAFEDDEGVFMPSCEVEAEIKARAFARTGKKNG